MVQCVIKHLTNNMKNYNQKWIMNIGLHYIRK